MPLQRPAIPVFRNSEGGQRSDTPTRSCHGALRAANTTVGSTLLPPPPRIIERGPPLARPRAPRGTYLNTTPRPPPRARNAHFLFTTQPLPPQPVPQSARGGLAQAPALGVPHPNRHFCGKPMLSTRARRAEPRGTSARLVSKVPGCQWGRGQRVTENLSFDTIGARSQHSFSSFLSFKALGDYFGLVSGNLWRLFYSVKGEEVTLSLGTPGSSQG